MSKYIRRYDIPATVWNGERNIVLLGAVIDWEPTKHGDNPPAKYVALFHSKLMRKWWLYYSSYHLTGHFDTRKAAMEFYERGGR